jgi:hypothetical protein
VGYSDLSTQQNNEQRSVPDILPRISVVSSFLSLHLCGVWCGFKVVCSTTCRSALAPPKQLCTPPFNLFDECTLKGILYPMHLSFFSGASLTYAAFSLQSHQRSGIKSPTWAPKPPSLFSTRLQHPERKLGLAVTFIVPSLSKCRGDWRVFLKFESTPELSLRSPTRRVFPPRAVPPTLLAPTRPVARRGQQGQDRGKVRAPLLATRCGPR